MLLLCASQCDVSFWTLCIVVNGFLFRISLVLRFENLVNGNSNFGGELKKWKSCHFSGWKFDADNSNFFPQTVMNIDTRDIRLLVESCRRNNMAAQQACDFVNKAWGKDTVALSTVYKLYREVTSGHRQSFDDASRSGRPSITATDQNAQKTSFKNIHMPHCLSWRRWVEFRRRLRTGFSRNSCSSSGWLRAGFRIPFPSGIKKKEFNVRRPSRGFWEEPELTTALSSPTKSLCSSDL